MIDVSRLSRLSRVCRLSLFFVGLALLAGCGIATASLSLRDVRLPSLCTASRLAGESSISREDARVTTFLCAGRWFCRGSSCDRSATRLLDVAAWCVWQDCRDRNRAWLAQLRGLRTGQQVGAASAAPVWRRECPLPRSGGGIINAGSVRPRRLLYSATGQR